MKSQLSRLGRQLEQLAYRSLDQHLRVGITGLSGAGKTAFVTSLVHQLLHADAGQLPMWEVVQQGRLLGAARQPQPDLALLPFDYDAAIGGLCQSEPQWPPSTRGISEIRLALRYVPAKGLKRQLADHLTLYLDLVDYPGEWLLDLPLLGMDFASWSQQQWQILAEAPWAERAQPWLDQIVAHTSEARALDDSSLGVLATEYGELLKTLRRELSATYLQPGRALLPGELAGTPILAFFPLPPEALASPLAQRLASRYQAYVQQVVKPFYRQHFARFDRQIVLLDALGALDQGHAQCLQMAQSVQAIMQSFQYGPGSLLRRLINPRIDKLLFVASKADHITVDQHTNLLALTDSLTGEIGRRARFMGGRVETMVLSAIRASQQGQVDPGSGVVPVIRGRDSAGTPVTRFPGEVPRTLPQPEFWQRQGFAFGALAPPALPDPHAPLPHMRMDHLLEWLLGDKMR
ncbi:YcjX family protein [Ferrimonas gelatinilytica]|uniref:YcjX family protein n=1 Tax=Ferrimonas gelatinilytica TaxID=1255257 RepID=A0ABP9RST7_9GAMM